MSTDYLKQASAELQMSEKTTEELKSRLAALNERLAEFLEEGKESQRADTLLSLAQVQIGLEQNADAWESARNAFDLFAADERWEQMAEACDAMFLSEQPDALVALGHAIWLAVTFPIDPAMAVGLLQHVIDETPDDADGAAVAAATAHYVVSLRCEGEQLENLSFFTRQMLATVAERHSQVTEQEQFDYWMEKLELNDPGKFLVRMRNVVDVLVQDNWWFDRDAIQARLPFN